jgi:hypothetical protein
MARVEVNGRKGILITVRTGSGQGDPLSSILFLIGSEPLNKLIVTKFTEIMYTTAEGVTVGPILFADDNLSPTNFKLSSNWNLSWQSMIDTQGLADSTSTSENPRLSASIQPLP